MSDVIARERKALGLNQSELAKMLNVSTRTVCTYEQPNSVIPSDKLIELSQIYDCDTDYLLGLQLERKTS